MRLLRKHIDLLRLVAFVLAGTTLSACTSWRTQTLEPASYRPADSTETVRLVLGSGDKLLMSGPKVVGDSFVGLRPGIAVIPDSLHRVSVPLTSVREVQVLKENGGENALVIVAVLISIAYVTRCSWSWC